ncbi:YheT family hydrolase [Gillisia marina]|uniref:YheT family hydrolase n=1 Tax=Gillisia marina TaxID=1167637 RepID=UPI00029B48BC|nr:alpha/beta fold hydrolase [Gillisia marina]
MPILKSTYNPPYIFRNYHISTIYSAKLRSVKTVLQTRERLQLEDGDFLDIDWSYAKSCSSNKVLIILHGLDGNAQRPYVMGLAHHFNRHAWDVAAINFRGCSGEINKLYRSYNAGASEDLKQVVTQILSKKKYESLAINGFSLGGNLLLKYLGEGNNLPKELKAGVAISAPCDLHASLKKLNENRNWLYSKRFVRQLKKQLFLREKHFPEKITKEQIANCTNLLSIDELYTSQAHGFTDALEYYEKSSALSFIPNIKTPTLLINAKNDGFLSENSSPVEMAKNNPNFYLETPEYGGHVGFLQNKEATYTEERALEFATSHL